MPTRSIRIEQLIEDWSPALQRAFRESIRNVRDRAQLDRLIDMLEQGDILGAVRAVGLDETAFRPFDRELERAFEAGGQFTIRAVPPRINPEGLRVQVNFNIRNPYAEQFLRDESSRRITEIVEDTRRMIREQLEASLRQGLNPRTAALDIVGRINQATGQREGGMIGLTSSQAAWVRNYEAELRRGSVEALTRALRDKRFDAAVLRAAKSGEPIPEAQVQAMVRAYRNRALRYRAETIARTEAMTSLHAAQDAAINQAIEAGQIDPSAVKFIWRTARDKRVRDSHAAMDGQERNFGESFNTGRGASLRYPGDPNGPPEEVINCRCWREPKIDFLKVLEPPGGKLPDREQSGKRSNAASLYQAPTKTAEQIIDEFPGGPENVAKTDAKLKQSVATDATPAKGGYRNADGTWTTERQALHKRLLDEIFTDERVRAAMPAPGELPTLSLLGGRGGSGKSFVTAPGGPVNPNTAILLDADYFKTKLPGYAGWNAGLFHEESSYIISLADRRAAELGINVILDGTLKTEANAITRLNIYGSSYNIDGYYIFAAPETAARRSLGRYSQNGQFTGRYVPPSLILNNTKNEFNFDQLSPTFRRWYVYDNNVDGRSPVLFQRSF